MPRVKDEEAARIGRAARRYQAEQESLGVSISIADAVTFVTQREREMMRAATQERLHRELPAHFPAPVASPADGPEHAQAEAGRIRERARAFVAEQAQAGRNVTFADAVAHVTRTAPTK
jgi:hypothetical protein